MPIYQYQCTKCEHSFEEFQKMTDEPIALCPNCGEPVQKVMSAGGFILKGWGWHKPGHSAG